jgi:hypothetical protein
MSDPSSQDPQRAKAPIVAGRDTRYHDTGGVASGRDIHGDIQVGSGRFDPSGMDRASGVGFVRVLAFLAGLLIVLVAVIVLFNVLT